MCYRFLAEVKQNKALTFTQINTKHQAIAGFAENLSPELVLPPAGLRSSVKLPTLPRGASVAKPSGTPPKPPVFALRATPRSPVAILPRASTRGILAKASDRGEVKKASYY